jgi:hypothetical protein
MMIPVIDSTLFVREFELEFSRDTFPLPQGERGCMSHG